MVHTLGTECTNTTKLECFKRYKNKIVGECFEQLYANKFDNFAETQNSQNKKKYNSRRNKKSEKGI